MAAWEAALRVRYQSLDWATPAHALYHSPIGTLRDSRACCPSSTTRTKKSLREIVDRSITAWWSMCRTTRSIALGFAHVSPSRRPASRTQTRWPRSKKLCPTRGGNPRDPTSLTTAATPGTRSSISYGKSFPSPAAIGESRQSLFVSINTVPSCVGDATLMASRSRASFGGTQGLSRRPPLQETVWPLPRHRCTLQQGQVLGRASI
jgi:hypothetical protein